MNYIRKIVGSGVLVGGFQLVAELQRVSCIEPLHYVSELAAAKARRVQIINQQARTQVIVNKDACLHATFTSLVFRFVDDVEFWFDDDNKLIHESSASRKGKYDFGTNRRRVESLRVRYHEH